MINCSLRLTESALDVVVVDHQRCRALPYDASHQADLPQQAACAGRDVFDVWLCSRLLKTTAPLGTRSAWKVDQVRRVNGPGG